MSRVIHKPADLSVLTFIPLLEEDERRGLIPFLSFPPQYMRTLDPCASLPCIANATDGAGRQGRSLSAGKGGRDETYDGLRSLARQPCPRVA